MIRALITASLLLPQFVFGQTRPGNAARAGSVLAYENFAALFGSRLAAALDSIPAAKYDYRPTPAQQTIGYIAQHLETANYNLCEEFGNRKHPRTAKDSLADTVKARWPKDTLVARYRASLQFCYDALASLRAVDSLVPTSYLLAFETDLAEHYSQLAAYMRLLGLVPPSALRPRQRRAIELPASALASYVGSYELAPGMQFDVTVKDSALFIKSSVAPAARLWPESPNDFFVESIDAQITFTRDQHGAVTGLVIHQFGRDRPAKRIR